ncbi:MAG: cation diffusion facilitator family transporter [Verrucomicrobia bacterium]|nr:cation diffusion facilitator family transporter [Verrucomicrobiota bacterium]
MDRLILRVAGDHPEVERKARLGLLQGWASVGMNSGIFLLKCVLGLVLGSIALVADSVDSLFDVLGSVIVVFSFYWFRRPRDREHPFGHGRVDLVAGLILAVLLIVVGVELARNCVGRILHPPEYIAPWWMIAAVAFSIPIKEGLAIFSRKIATATGLSSMEASYWYLRFDAITSATVTAGLLLSRWGWVAVDGWIGLFIAGVIAWTGILLVVTRISPLLGEAPARDEVDAVEQVAGRQAGVRGVHDVILHKYGDVKLVSFHIEVDAHRSALDAHDLAERVEAAVEKATGCKAIVHVDPVDREHPAYARARQSLVAMASRDRRLVGFHDLRVSGREEAYVLSVDLVASVDIPESAHEDIARLAEQSLKSDLPGVEKVRITVEAAYTGEAAEKQERVPGPE